MGEKKMKVLVVDDEKIVRDFFSRLLTLQGLEVVAVEDGYKAVELARQGGEFDLFFIDIRMPGLNGLETCRSIRQINPQAKIVMMTGYTTDDISKELEKEDLAGFIRKPFDLSEIKGIMNSVVAKKRGPLNILVIDDDPVILNFFANLLKNKNQRYKIANNKNEALAAASQEKFDLVFLDLVLKEVNGISTYKEIKQVLPEATIVVITGFPQKAEELKGAAEIAGCLYKPFEIERVLEYIDRDRS